MLPRRLAFPRRRRPIRRRWPHNVLTLIAAEPACRCIGGGRSRRRALHRLGARRGGDGLAGAAGACDIAFDGLDPDQADARRARRGRGARADRRRSGRASGGRAAQAAARRRHGIDDHRERDARRARRFARPRRRTSPRSPRRAMNGEIDFAAALKRARGAAHRPAGNALAEAARAHPPDAGRRRAGRDDARATAPMRRWCRAALRFFADRVGAALGFDLVVANGLEIADGKLAGTVREPIVGPRRKLATLLRSPRSSAAAARRRSRSATAPTICRCSRRPASASPFTPSPRSPPARACASITPT